MRAIKILQIVVVLFSLLGCSSSRGGDSPDDGGDSGEGNTSFTLSEFSTSYNDVQSDSKVKDRNFYWTTLLENNATVKGFIENNADLSAFLSTINQRLGAIANQTNATAAQYATALKFSGTERIAISTAVKATVEANASTFINFSNSNIGPSGAFNHFQDVTDVARLQQLIVEEMLLGLNQIIDTYAAGIDPKYPDIDKVSYNVNSAEYKSLLKNLVTQLNASKDQYTLFYQPVMDFALGVLDLNNRDEAGRFVPLKSGENQAALQSMANIKWGDYDYSMIVVPGDAPNSSGDLPNISIGGMERCDYAVNLFNQGLAPLLCFSGGNVHPFQTEFHEAVEMKKYVMDTYNIPASKILVDPHARHTTTNMRNVGRLVFKYGIPESKKVLLSTTASQSEYIASNQFSTRCMTEMGHIPMEIHNRISDRDLEFTAQIKVLHLDSSDPLDP